MAQDPLVSSGLPKNLANHIGPNQCCSQISEYFPIAQFFSIQGRRCDVDPTKFHSRNLFFMLEESTLHSAPFSRLL